jgi:Variant SH3 domain/Cytoskeletal-regulatory complex EF hand
MTTVRALYSCDATESPDELSFQKGDVIENAVESQESGWYYGVLQKSGESGLFPFNYVEIVPTMPGPSKPRKILADNDPKTTLGNARKENTSGSTGKAASAGDNRFRASPQELGGGGPKSSMDIKSSTEETALSNSEVEGSLSVKALKARLENSKTTPQTAKQPVPAPAPKPAHIQAGKPHVNQPAPISAPIHVKETEKTLQDEEDVAFMKPSELRKKWAAVDAASKQSLPPPVLSPSLVKRPSMVTTGSSQSSHYQSEMNDIRKGDTEEIPIIRTATNPDVPKRVSSSLGSYPSPPMRPNTSSNRSSILSDYEKPINPVPSRPTSALLEPQAPPRRLSPSSPSHPSPPMRSNSSTNRNSNTLDISRPPHPIPNRPNSAVHESQAPPRVMPRRPQVQSQIYPGNQANAPPLPSRPRSSVETLQKSSGPTPPPRPLSSRRQSQAMGNGTSPRPTSHLPPPPTAAIRKTIPIADRIKYDAIFKENNEQGYMYQDTAVEIWRDSRIGEQNLSDIVKLIDIRGDGWFDQKQFAAGTFLIDDRLRGFCIPKSLPDGIM